MLVLDLIFLCCIYTTDYMQRVGMCCWFSSRLLLIGWGSYLLITHDHTQIDDEYSVSFCLIKYMVVFEAFNFPLTTSEYGYLVFHIHWDDPKLFSRLDDDMFESNNHEHDENEESDTDLPNVPECAHSSRY